MRSGALRRDASASAGGRMFRRHTLIIAIRTSNFEAGRQVPVADGDVRFPGGHRSRVTPVPIPNTEVKPATADGTAWVTVWESRSLPGLFLRAGRKQRDAAFFFVRRRLRPDQRRISKTSPSSVAEPSTDGPAHHHARQRVVERGQARPVLRHLLDLEPRTPRPAA